MHTSGTYPSCKSCRFWGVMHVLKLCTNWVIDHLFFFQIGNNYICLWSLLCSLIKCHVSENSMHDCELCWKGAANLVQIPAVLKLFMHCQFKAFDIPGVKMTTYWLVLSFKCHIMNLYIHIHVSTQYIYIFFGSINIFLKGWSDHLFFVKFATITFLYCLFFLIKLHVFENNLRKVSLHVS